MNYIIESVFVGCYTVCIYLIISSFLKNLYIVLLVCGFIKHFVGSYIGLWSWYCNNGEACKKVLKGIYKSNNKCLIQDSINESIIFLLIGTLLSFIIKNNICLYLLLGAILHILGEKMGIHKTFCEKNCEKYRNN